MTSKTPPSGGPDDQGASDRNKRTTRMALTLAAAAAGIYLLYIGYFVGTAMAGG